MWIVVVFTRFIGVAGILLLLVLIDGGVIGGVGIVAFVGGHW